MLQARHNAYHLPTLHPQIEATATTTKSTYSQDVRHFTELCLSASGGASPRALRSWRPKGIVHNFTSLDTKNGHAAHFPCLHAACPFDSLRNYSQSILPTLTCQYSHTKLLPRQSSAIPWRQILPASLSYVNIPPTFRFSPATARTAHRPLPSPRHRSPTVPRAALREVRVFLHNIAYPMFSSMSTSCKSP